MGIEFGALISYPPKMNNRVVTRFIKNCALGTQRGGNELRNQAHSSIRRGRLLIGVSLALALVTASCGGSDEPAESGDADTTVEVSEDSSLGDSTETTDPGDGGSETTEPDGGTETVAPSQEGGTLTIATAADAQPSVVLATRAGNNLWRRQVYDTLTSINRETGQPEPLLATDWEWIEDGAGWKMVVNLREGVTFHSGREFTAEDVIFTFDTQVLPESASQTAAVLNRANSWEATGPLQVTIFADSPVGNIFDAFALAVILDPETFAGVADGTEVIGTGPFMWDEWQPGSSLKLVRNPNYWQAGVPKLDAVEYAIITDPTALVAAMQSGRADVVFDLPTLDAQLLLEDNAFQPLVTPGPIFPLGMDITQAPFDQVEVRQAVGYAIDRERIVDQVFQGAADPSVLFWKTTEPGMDDSFAYRYSYDPDRARQMIEDAGVAGTEIELLTLNIPNVVAVAEIVQNNLTEAGFVTSLNVMDTAQFDERQAAGDLGPIFQQIHGLNLSAASLVDAFPALRDGNPSQLDDPLYRELRDTLQAATDEESYATALQALADYMLETVHSLSVLRGEAINVQGADVDGIVYTAEGVMVLANAGFAE